jgi:hypothetical protein
MDSKILQGSADFLAAATLLRSSFQPDLADQMPVILVGLKKHLLAAADGRETPDSPVPAILRYAAARIPLPELQQIIAQTFQGDTMIQGQAFKSAAEVWYEEGEAKGRIEGRKDGLLRGRLIGQIQLLQQLLKRPVSADAQLEQLPLEDLRTLFEGLQRQKPEQN